MKWLFVIFSFIVSVSCVSRKPIKNQIDKKEHISLKSSEEEGYDVVVFDSGYDIFLATKAFPLGYYTESFLHNKNIQLVREWNYRHSQSNRYNPSIYEVYIDYDLDVRYGLEFEWKLFNFFMFIEDQTGEDLDGFRPYTR